MIIHANRSCNEPSNTAWSRNLTKTIPFRTSSGSVVWRTLTRFNSLRIDLLQSAQIATTVLQFRTLNYASVGNGFDEERDTKMIDIVDKVAFVTGGGSGIGRGMATVFLKAGLKVVIVDIRQDRLARVKEALDPSGSRLFAIEADVSQIEALERAADLAESHFGKIHIVCNNAGIGIVGPVSYTPMDRWRKVVDVNLWGVVNGCQVFTPRIHAHGEGGHIVNTASIMGLFTTRGTGPYCATKFSVIAISECLHQELQDTNIGVSVLCPFIVDTPIFYPDLDDLDTEAIEKRKKQISLLKHAVTPVFAGETVLKAIQNNDFYIFTDGEQSRQMLQSRVDVLLAGMNRQWPEEKDESEVLMR